MKKNVFLLLLLFLTSIPALISQNQLKENTKSSSSIKESIQDNDIVVPENLNKNVSKLLHEWQIDFSNSKNQCSKGLNVVYSDSVYMQRLYDLPTMMELSYNSVVRSYIDMYTVRRRDMVSYILTLGDYYNPIFEEALDRYGLPLELKYLPVIESTLNPVAVSRMGATGLWQFMLQTGKQYKLDVNSLVDERRDPYKATEAAAKYLNDLYKIYEDWNLVIAAYNCGPGNVNKAIARSGGKRDYWDIYYHLPKETRGYVPVFIAANYVMNYYDKHHICPQETANDLMALDTVHVSHEVHFKQISDVLNIPMEQIRRYNPQFKRDIIPGNHKSYALVLPTEQMYAFISNKDEIVNHNKSIYLTHRKETLDNLNAGLTTGNKMSNTYYRVKKGDTMGGIARRNGTTVARLQRMNGMKTSRISIGKRMIVKQSAQPIEVVQKSETVAGGEIKKTYYRVKKGDSLGRITSRNGTTVAKLQSMNGMRSTKLSIGKNIVVKQVIKPAPKVDAEIAEEEVKYERIESSNSSESIITEYLNKKAESNSDKEKT